MKRKIAVIDCETDPFQYGRVPEPFIWGFYDGSEYHEFATTELLIDFLKNKNLIVYAHNGGKFDYHFLLPAINKYEKILIINSRLAKFKIGNCEFRDSYNILPVPLSALNKDQFDYRKMEKDVRHEHMDEIRTYLRHDCMYLYDAIIDFIERYGLHLTQATAAIKHWEKLGNKIPKTSAAYFLSVKDYYYGGRVTPFRKGIFNGKYDIIDINSAYPRAMKEYHPWGIRRTIKSSVSDEELPRAMLDVECLSLGALPKRMPDGSLSFPEEKGIFKITGHEFIAGLETNTIKNARIISAQVWEEKITFSDYVDYFYSEKLRAEKAGDKAGRLFAKLLMNSLYGKFASNPERYREYSLCNYGDVTPKGWEAESIIGSYQLLSRPLAENFQHYYNVAVSASITGWVRAYLWKAINKVSEPLYCDTDSIICRDKSNIEIGDQLGQWSNEGTAKKIGIAGKKLYACLLTDGRWKIASKGARLTPDEIMSVAAGKTVIYRSDVPTFSLKNSPYFLERHIAMC